MFFFCYFLLPEEQQQRQIRHRGKFYFCCFWKQKENYFYLWHGNIFRRSGSFELFIRPNFVLVSKRYCMLLRDFNGWRYKSHESIKNSLKCQSEFRKSFHAVGIIWEKLFKAFSTFFLTWWCAIKEWAEKKKSFKSPLRKEEKKCNMKVAFDRERLKLRVIWKGFESCWINVHHVKQFSHFSNYFM